ncbi:hypothetical protein HKD37_07G019475 [Glycine soja]
MEVKELVPILPTPMILPMVLPPYVTCPLFLGEMVVNLDTSLVICLEHPLPIYEFFLLDSSSLFS